MLTNSRTYIRKWSSVLFLAVCTVSFSPAYADMVGPKSIDLPNGDLFSDGAPWPGGGGWKGVYEVSTSDDGRANLIMDPSTISNALGGNFGFTLPPGAVINGVEVSIERRGQKLVGTNIVSVSLLNGLTLIGVPKLDSTWLNRITDEILILGGPTDTWGATASDLASVFATGGAIALRVITTESSNPNTGFDGSEFEIDHITMSVYFTVPATTLTVAIDIKPGSDPNCFNINGHGVIPVAILGSVDLDVNDIQFDTLKFDGLAVRVRGNKGPLCSIEDSNDDLFPDLVCHFEDDPENWTAGSDLGTVSGKLLDSAGGTPIEGTDSICIVQ